MNQKLIMIPTKDAESWKALLAEPEKHWKAGCSAMSVAISWEQAHGIPSSIVKALNSVESLSGLELLLAIPEYKVALPGGPRPSQNDILVVGRNDDGLTIIAVEAKAKEGFDQTISEWKKDGSEGKKERLDFILEKISFPPKNTDTLRYQLFHRLASAVIMAEKYHANNAVMLIQSFDDSEITNHYADYSAFVESYDVKAEKGMPILLCKKRGIDIYGVWVNDIIHK